MRWAMLAILFLVRLAMGFEFQAIASTSSELIAQFGLTFAQVGTLIGLFLLPGVVIAVPSGLLTRRFSDKHLLMAGAMLMALGALLIAWSSDRDGLYLGRIVAGIGGTIFNVILTKMVTEWFLGKELVLALSIMLTAWPIGIAMGLLMHGRIASVYDWSGVMITTALVSLLALILTARFYRPPPAASAGPPVALRYTLPGRQFFLMSLVGIAWALFNAGLIVLVSFAPGLLQAFGRSTADAQSMASLMMWATLVSLPLGGQLMGKLVDVTPAITVAMLLATAFAFGLAWGVPPVAALIAFGLVAGMPAGALMSLTAQAITPDNRGPGLGIFYTWYYLGMTIAPAVTGWLRDVTGDPAAPVMMAGSMMAGVALFVNALRQARRRWPPQPASPT